MTSLDLRRHPSTDAAPRGAGASPQSAGRPLGTTAASFPAKSRRAERYALRAGAQQVTTLPGLRKCGVVPIRSGVSLRADATGKRAGYGGLSTCGSVWACPVCSAKISARRKSELEAVLEHAQVEGLFVSMLTLTQRHHQGQRLADLWAALSYAWNGVTSGRRWQEFKRQLGVVGYVRATEVTCGSSGWHVHSHIVVISRENPLVTPLFFQRAQGRRREPWPVEMQLPADFVADRWQARLAKKGVDFLRDRGGLDWQTAAPGDAVAIGRYLAKMQTGGEKPRSGADSLSSEATLGAFKRARSGNRSPFQILADLLETGDYDDCLLWWEYEKASRGKRALTWSKGLRGWANLGAEKTDEEIAQEDFGDAEIARFSGEAWKAVRRAGAAALLDICDEFGPPAALAWLDAHGIEWDPPPPKQE